MKPTRPTSPVLVVEDDPDQRDAIVLALENAGYTVLGAGDGGEALELLQAGTRPCVILLDLMLPDVDGVQFRKEQLASPTFADVPVVVVSAYGQRTRAKHLQVADYLQKPVEIDRLLAVVERVSRLGA
jgi:two-component system, chemotaxis family, chemotaxis protein CheY